MTNSYNGSSKDGEKNSYVQSPTRTNQSAVETVSINQSKNTDGTYSDQVNTGYKPEFSSDTPLNNGATFDTGIVDLSGYDYIINEIYADQDGQLQGFWYDDADGTNLIRTFTSPYNATNNDLQTFGTTTLSRYLRYVFTNNSGSDQSVFRLRLKVTNNPPAPQILELGQFIPSNILANVSRSILSGQNELTGNYNNVKLSKDDNLLVDIDNIARTSFNELKTASRYSQIELKSAVDQVSALRNNIEATDASVTISSTGEYLVQTDAVLAGNVLFESGERGRYIPGYEAEFGMGIRIPSQTWSGTQYAEWGYFDDNNGIGWGVDSGGIYIFIDRLGTRTKKVYQSNWNKDVLDGSSNTDNPSGFNLDLTDGNIFQVEFIWYGYGAIQWIINKKDINDKRGNTAVLAHLELPDDQTSVSQPNLPLSVKVDNGDQSTSREVYVGGRQYSVYGQPNERFRVNGERRTSVSLVNTAWRPVISFRRKSNIGNNQSVELTAANVVPDANIIYTFVSGGTLTGASFGNLTDVSPTETVVESDVSATAITGGTFFGGEYIATGNNKAETLGTLEQLDFDFVNTDIVTMVARSIGATATIEVATLNVREQW